MKFIIRDDDVNYFYQPAQLKRWYEGIYEICPISICVVPFVKGDYFKWVYWAEHDKEDYMKHKDEFYDDDNIYPLGDNQPLIETFKKWESEGKISISMHGIYHRNWDRNAPDIENNYSTGAEFWTDEDRTAPLKDAKLYLEEVIGHSISAFTAPQNLISYTSYRSLREAGFNVCGNIVNPRKPIWFIDIHGFKTYIKVFMDYMLRRKLKPKIQYESKHKGLKFITYTAGVYPNGKTLDEVKSIIDFVNSSNGTFVFNTHSYGFDDYLPQANMTVKEFTIEIVNYAKSLGNVEFTTLEKELRN